MSSTNLKALLLTVCSILISSSVRADTFYRETFNFCELDSGRPSAFNVASWKAFTSAHEEGKPSILKIQPSGAATLLPAVSSNPEGPEDGAAIWARDDVNRGLHIFTDEISFDISDLTSVIWRQRVDRQDKAFANYGARLAFLIDGQWYISDYSATQQTRGVFERRELSPFSTTYGTTAPNGTLGINTPTNSGVSLPTQGTVTAFGLFFIRSFANVRIDDFALVDRSPAGTHPGTHNFSRCPTATTDPNVAPDDGVPPPAPPPPEPTPNPKPTPDPGTEEPSSGPFEPTGFEGYCAADNADTRIIMFSKTRKKLLKRATGKSLRRYRDRALLALVSRGLPLSAISGIQSDALVEIDNKPYLTLADGQEIRVSRSFASDLSHYLQKAGIDADFPETAFRQLSSNGKSVTEAPLCVTDLVRVIRGHARRAKVSGQVIVF